MTSHPRFLSLVLFGIGSMSAPDALAWIPHSSHLIQKVAGKHTRLKGLRVKTRITGTENQLKEVFWLDMNSRTMKARILDAHDQEIYAYQRPLNENDSLVSQILFESNTLRLTKSLQAAGIPVVSEEALNALGTEDERRAAEKSKVERLNGKTGWSIGRGFPSFWVVKDEYIPLKLLFKPDGRETEVRFEETPPKSDFSYPRSITLLRNNEFVLKGEAMEVMFNPDLTDMKKIAVTAIPPIPEQLDSATRKLIETWIQWIR